MWWLLRSERRQKISSNAFGIRIFLLLVFSVTPFKIDQNKNQNRSIDKVQNLGNERTLKGGKYTKTLAKIQVRGIFRIRDIRRNALPKLIEICMETPHKLVHTGMNSNMADENQQKYLLPFCYKSGNLFFEKLINTKVILFLINELFG